MERIFTNQSAVVHISTKFLTQRTFNRSGVFQRLNRAVRRGSHGDIERVEQVSMTVHRIFYGDVRRGSVPVAPVNRCPLAINVKNQPELRMRLVLPDLDMISGAFVFQSLTLHPTANPVDPSRKTDPFTITSHCTYPLKRPQPLSGAKNAKRQENTRPNQKNAPESFLDGCITMHESDPRSVLCVLNTERVKMTRFLSLNGAFYTEIFVPLSIILITGFPS